MPSVEQPSNKKKKTKRPSDTSKKKKRSRDTTSKAIVPVAKQQKINLDDPVGQLAKATRCTALWNTMHAAEADSTGGILDGTGSELTAEESGFARISDIREAKAYKHALRKYTQLQLRHHLNCISILCRLTKKRTADLEIVSAYQMITSCANPKLAHLAFRTEEDQIALLIHNHMHFGSDEDNKLVTLRKTLRTVLPQVTDDVQTRDGIVAFVRQYTDDDYFSE
jgi:hypothetical protein